MGDNQVSVGGSGGRARRRGRQPRGSRPAAGSDATTPARRQAPLICLTANLCAGTEARFRTGRREFRVHQAQGRRKRECSGGPGWRCAATLGPPSFAPWPALEIAGRRRPGAGTDSASGHCAGPRHRRSYAATPSFTD